MRSAHSLVLVLVGSILGADLRAQNGESAPSASGAVDLGLAGDPAPALDLGAAHRLPAVTRSDPSGPVTLAPYACRTCLANKNQALVSPAKTLTRLLFGRSLVVVEPWLASLAGSAPVILELPHATIVSMTDGAPPTAKDAPEIARVRAFLPAPPGGKAGLDRHETGHLWAERMLALDGALEDLLALPAAKDAAGTGLLSAPAPERAEVCLFGSEKTAREFGNQILDRAAPPVAEAVVHGNPVSAILVAGAPEPLVLRRVLYGATRATLHARIPADSPMPPWVTVGVALFMARRVPVPPDVKDEPLLSGAERDAPRDWDQFVRDLVLAGKSAELGALSTTTETGLTVRSRLQAWSLVKFLVGVDRRRFAAFHEKLRSAPPGTLVTKALLEAVRGIYGVDLPALENAWKTWVLRSKG